MTLFSWSQHRPRPTLVFAFVVLCTLPYAQAATCGQGGCENGETCNSCPRDCCPTCGDGFCYTRTEFPRENVTNCAKDCDPACGDGVCSTSPPLGYSAENAANCPKDCSSPVCGDGVCSVNPLTGTAENTSNCARDCIAICGDGTCTTAPINGTAENATNCAKDCDPACGDGVCSTSPPSGYNAESSSNCPKDCGPTFCGDKVCALKPISGTAENVTSCPSDCSCGDGYCDAEFESCFWCDDCSCSFDGVRVRVWESKAKNINVKVAPPVSSPVQLYSSSKIEFPANYVNQAGPLYIVMDSYLKVNATQHYTFQFVTNNIGFKFQINGNLVTSSQPQAEGRSTTRVVLQEEYIHRILIEVESFSSLTKSLSLNWKSNDDAEFQEFSESFYSYNVCGDHIFDVSAESISCPTDNKLKKTFNAASDVCGDGLCLERFPETCFMDCYTELSRTCSPIAVPPGHISSGLPVRDDTFGSLIRNQMLWHLPGIEHMSYGFNLATAEQALNPIFYFGYCDEKRLSTVQDTYRGNVYTVPEELYAQPLPKCTFTVDSKSFSSAAKMAESASEDISIEVSASVDVNAFVYKGSGSISFSAERSVKTASELEKKTSGSIIVSEVQCATTRVKLAKKTFHPAFLEDLRKAKTINEWKNLVTMYGTHVYSSAVLGGKLRQITTLSKEFQSSKTSQELEEHAALSLSASVSGPAFSASGSFSGSIDTSTSSENQQEYEGSSFRSSVITYGGPPGSFGPTTSDAPSNFGDWASSIDLLPVPIDYTLTPIYDIIPEAWTMKFNGQDRLVRDLWAMGDSSHATGFRRLSDGPQPVKYTLWWVWNNGATASTSSTFYDLIITYNGGNTTLRIRDQSAGAQGGWIDWGDMSTPFSFDFYLPSSITPTNIIIKTNIPDYIVSVTIGQQTNREIWGGERSCEVLLHNWQTGVGWWANNFEYTTAVSTTLIEKTHNWNIALDKIGVYQIHLEIAHAGGQTQNQAVFEFTLVGINDTLRDTLTWKNYVWGPGPFHNIKFWGDDRPKIGVITEVHLRLSNSYKVDNNSTTQYKIKNVWLHIPSCDTTVFSQACATSTTAKVFHALPEREYLINNYDPEPIRIPVNPLETYNF